MDKFLAVVGTLAGVAVAVAKIAILVLAVVVLWKTVGVLDNLDAWLDETRNPFTAPWLNTIPHEGGPALPQ